jgi:hypothetical protein
MAELYLARSRGIEGFEKVVVLKRILPQYAQNRDFVTMFLDEARLSATLQHPNIAQVHDIGQWHGSYFFTMEYIHGQDVRGILQAAARRHQRIPLAQALTMITGAAAGLHAAHEKRSLDGRPLRIVHRDVSPSNVLVSYDGGVKVVDFGVAKAAQRQTETQAGTLKGKIAYMSPEQCLGKPLDRRSDIFSLGILLYELTTGRRLFKGDAEFAVMQRIVNEDVTPPSHLVASYPPDLEAIVVKALRRERDERYSTAQDLQLDLESFASAHRLALSQVMLARFMQTLFADVLRDENSQGDAARAGTDIFDLPARPGPRTHVFAAGAPVPGAAIGAPGVGGSLGVVAVGSQRMDPVPPPIPARALDEADPDGVDTPAALGVGRIARLGSVPVGFGDHEHVEPIDETASIVISTDALAGEGDDQAPPRNDPTRIGSISRSFAQPDGGSAISGSVQVQAHRRAVMLSAVIGAGVAAGVVAAVALFWARTPAPHAPPATPVAAPPVVAAPPAAAPAPQPTALPAVAAEGTAADAGAPAATGDAEVEGTAARAEETPKRSKRRSRKSSAPAAEKPPTVDWGLDSPLPPE